MRGFVMVYQLLKNTDLFIPKKLVSINLTAQKVISISEKAKRKYIYVTELTRTYTRPAGITKRNVNFLEAIACQDGIYTFVSGVGIFTNSLNIVTFFIPKLRII